MAVMPRAPPSAIIKSRAPRPAPRRIGTPPVSRLREVPPRATFAAVLGQTTPAASTGHSVDGFLHLVENSRRHKVDTMRTIALMHFIIYFFNFSKSVKVEGKRL
ncbi:hypothetical protein Nepgr_031697 [Nepenthes gracilis]|uniref:Uncharacterized protein n=1 Tax=Nepenthes gracilis TaxID=150966 RepID=A0AAD3TIR8_NEPGR|nr:hypothetical protein Nepgr_031697 [Nepenthes gracilis]